MTSCVLVHRQMCAQHVTPGPSPVSRQCSATVWFTGARWAGPAWNSVRARSDLGCALEDLFDRAPMDAVLSGGGVPDDNGDRPGPARPQPTASRHFHDWKTGSMSRYAVPAVPIRALYL